jgi:cholesterol oxidase
MVGCKVGAKNTLDRNYLFLAEKRGAQVFPERKVERIEPMEGGGYKLHTVRSTSIWRKDRRVFTAQKVVVSAGVLGSVNLLLKNKQEGTLSKLSNQLGAFVRTNSEAILGVTQKKAEQDFTAGIAIGSRADLDEHTHLEPCRYPPGSNALAFITTPLTDGGGSTPRWLRWFGENLKSPVDALRGLWPGDWSKRTVVLLVMQNLDNQLRLVRQWRWWWPFDKGLSTVLPDGQKPAPTYIPLANTAARTMAAKVGGMARSSITEALLDVPTTAHILGGCAMGKSAEDGVIDWKCQVFGYEGLYVVDGSMIGANLGVNPSLTITALAEHAMSHIPPKAHT